tara:strand:+ start:3542 stop:3907 length:366 start_codon:yes stop_codon:yes gene_type:complete
MTDLKPCPFCGGGETQFDDTQNWTGMRYQHVCTTLRHFCERPTDDEFVQAVITIRGRDEEDCTRRWNTRATDRDAILEEAARECGLEHIKYMTSIGRDPDKYVSRYSSAAAAIRAMEGGEG